MPVEAESSHELVDAGIRDILGAHLHVGVVELDKAVDIAPVIVAQADTAVERVVHGIDEVAEGVHLATFDRDVDLRECRIGRVLRERERAKAKGQRKQQFLHFLYSSAWAKNPSKRESVAPGNTGSPRFTNSGCAFRNRFTTCVVSSGSGLHVA